MFVAPGIVNENFFYMIEFKHIYLGCDKRVFVIQNIKKVSYLFEEWLMKNQITNLMTSQKTILIVNLNK